MASPAQKNAPPQPSPEKVKEASEKLEAAKKANVERASLGRSSTLELRETWAKDMPAKGKGKGKGKKGKGKGKGKGRDKAIQSLERNLEWKRKESLKVDYPPRLKQPKFGQVKDLNPGSKGVNLMVKAMKCAPVETGDSASKIWEAVCGDDTAVVTLRLRSDEQAKLCESEGASLRIQNAKVSMFKGFIRLVVDKWAVLKAADDKLAFEVNSGKDMSSTEYELVDS